MAITQQKALSKVFGDPQKKVLRKLEKRVGAINALAKKYEKMSDEELQKQTDVLKKRLKKKGETVDTILSDAFAVAREAASRTLDMRPFDVQLIGGIAGHQFSLIFLFCAIAFKFFYCFGWNSNLIN